MNLYVDDTGSLKGLPHNDRASSLASEAGYPVDVRGDAFVGRVMDSDAEFKRLDFTFDDVRLPTFAPTLSFPMRLRNALTHALPAHTPDEAGGCLDGGGSAPQCSAA